MYGSINNIEKKEGSKYKNCLIYVLISGLILLVALGFGIGILTILNLKQLNNTLESYSQIATLTRELIFKTDFLINNVTNEIPEIDLIINNFSKIIKWVCKNYPEINC